MKHIMEIIKTCWNGNPSARFTSYICRKRMDERQQLLLDKKAKAVAQTAGVTVQDRKILGPQKPKDESPANGAPRIVQKEIDREDEQENWRGKNFDQAPIVDRATKPGPKKNQHFGYHVYLVP